MLQPEECRIAIIEDGVLEELYVERTSHESYTGNIYKGRIVNLEPSIQAAFVDFSVGRNGFLHVSDVEPQYFERITDGGPEELDPGARERDRERKRDPRRGRGRDERRGPPSRPEPLPPPPGMPPAPPRLEDRPRERGRERDRDKDRGRERERPDLSVKGRRDRSDITPRYFGEGLVEPPDPRSQPDRPVAPAPSHPHLAFEEVSPPALTETPGPAPSVRPETPERTWEEEFNWPREREAGFGPAPEKVSERGPAREPGEEPFGGRGFRPIEPVDPDLPPSRTNRPRGPAGPTPPGEIEGNDRGRYRAAPSPPSPLDEWPRTGAGPLEPELESPGGRDPRRGRGRGRPSPPPGRSRPVPPVDREGPLIPGFEPGPEPDAFVSQPDFEGPPRLDEPPRRRGGRAAIRSRGGEWEGPRDAPPRQDVGPERPPRGLPAPDDFESERRRPPAPERRPDIEGRRPPGPPEPPRDRSRDRDRDRPQPHDRAGEPGYVPRRERLRSGEPAFGAEIFPPTTEWPEREVDPLLEGETDPRMAELAEEDEPGGFPDSGIAGQADAARPDGRRRRRRRGRRRERPKGELSPPSPIDEPETEFDDFGADVEPAAPFTRGRAPVDDTMGDLDDLDLDELEGDAREGFEVDEFAGDELADIPVSPVDEEIDLELEQEIRREIEEIEELEREMGLRGPADAKPRRGDEPARGGRSGRGRGLLKPPIQEIFRRGDEVLVQVIKESIGNKGPTLSTYISIPGRYLVLMPGLNRVGVSRKIVDEGQRRKLRDIMRELNPPQGLGFIVRTAGLERTKRELARDLAYLLRLWKVILRRIKKAKAPAPIYQESDMIIRTIRDIFNSEIDTIWIDEPSAFERAQDFLKVVMPRFVNRLKLYDEKVPLFHKYSIEDEISKIQRRHVPLPEGGSIVIDQTEALVAIDVNSGNFRVEDDAERTAYEMNLRAAKEIARQLRLRDLGGVIVNDFIDMREERHRRGVERAVREAIKRDRARTKVLRMSAFGLIEMTRQRIRPSLKRSVYEDCHHCTGAGVVKTAESMAIDVMRLLALATHREEIRRMAISVHPSVAAYLSNRKRKEIARLESECNMTIQISFDPSSPAEHLKIECFDANGNEVRMLPPPASAPHKRGH